VGKKRQVDPCTDASHDHAFYRWIFQLHGFSDYDANRDAIGHYSAYRGTTRKSRVVLERNPLLYTSGCTLRTLPLLNEGGDPFHQHAALIALYL
jgi:hypothetical protein